MSVGTLTTATYDERTSTFNTMNPKFDRSSVLPQAHYFGKPLTPGKDRFDRRTVAQLDNQDLDGDESEDPEELLNLKRMKTTILNQENIKKILNDETECLDLEAKYWLMPSFIEKIGHLAKNLLQISLRRMNHI